MKTIQLTQGQVALVDDDDYEWLSQYKWYARWDKYTKSYYAARAEYFPIRKTVYMAREVAKTPKGMICDHINHDTLDNRKENLRNVTNSQNLMNRKGAASNNKLGERCVRKERNGFRVQVSVGGKYVFNKTFRTLPDAIVARDDALKQYHGEYSPNENNSYPHTLTRSRPRGNTYNQ